jgi:hypothetical protein
MFCIAFYEYYLSTGKTDTEPVFLNLLSSPGIVYQPWRAGTTTLFDVPTRQPTQARGIDFLESIPVLLKRLQIRAPYLRAVNFLSSVPVASTGLLAYLPAHKKRKIAIILIQ